MTHVTFIVYCSKYIKGIVEPSPQPDWPSSLVLELGQLSYLFQKLEPVLYASDTKSSQAVVVREFLLSTESHML